MSNVGIKVSRVGVSVQTTNIEDLIFTTKYPIWKVSQEEAVSVTITGGQTLGYTDTSHSLGYRPFVIGFAQPDTGSSRRLLLVGRTPVTGSPRKYLQTTATNFRTIYEKVPAPGSDETFSAYVYTMVDQLSS